MINKLASVLLICTLFFSTSFQTKKPGYDEKFVSISTVEYKKEKITVARMLLDGERVKVKYFASKDNNGNSVYKRYEKWSKGKNIILISSGTYFNASGQPDGLTIDNGVIVNNTLSDKFQGLVVVNNRGGITVSDIKQGSVSMKCETGNKTFDIRKQWDKTQFCACAEEQEATVFQTHLLLAKDVLKIGTNSSTAQSKRRFLATCIDEDGKTVHAIVHILSANTLYDGTVKVFNFLKNYADMQEVTSMINLDVGGQDVFQLYDKKGKIVDQGALSLEKSNNILSYYFQ